MIKKRNKIIFAVASRVRIKNMKYGMKISTSITEAYDIDKENGNTLWREVIKRKMENVSVAFEILEDGKRPSAAQKKVPFEMIYDIKMNFTRNARLDGKRPSAAHKKVPFHMIYDIKMNFTRKARLVAEGCRTPNSVTSTYVGVVSRESARIAFTYAALNGMEVWAD